MEVPAQSHAPLPGEPARESPLLKAKVRDTETGTAERGRGKARGRGEGGGQTKSKNEKKHHMPAALGWTPTTASSIHSHSSCTLLILLQGSIHQPRG